MSGVSAEAAQVFCELPAAIARNCKKIAGQRNGEHEPALPTLALSLLVYRNVPVTHDVFISYSSSDEAAARAVSKFLRASGVRCWLALDDIVAGRKWSEAIITALGEARVMVVLISAASSKSEQVEREVERAAHRHLPIIPFRIEDVPLSKSLEYFISSPHWLDAYQQPLQQHFEKLLRAVRENIALFTGTAPPASSDTTSSTSGLRESPDTAASNPNKAQSVASMKLCLLYKRGIAPDERLLGLLETHLKNLGHSVFVDRHLTIGVAWAQEIEKQIRQSDAVIPLLSEASVQSEMLSYEVQVARDASRQEPGKPRLLPVRIAYEGALPHDMASALGRLQYFLWKGLDDDQRLIEHVATAVSSPPRKVIPSGKLEAVGGAVPLDSEFYIVRPSDVEFFGAIARRDAIVLVKGARQMGKTSLLARGLQHARNTGAKVAFMDFQKLTTDQLASTEAFYVSLGEFLADQLELEVHPRDKWDVRRGPTVNFDRFIRREILKTIDSHLVWGLDEVDRLFTCPFGSEVFALFRTWHNERALDPSGPWAKFTLAIAYATEAHLFITDVNQSPFNVGTRLALQDFTLEQVADLNARYGSPLSDGREVAQFFRLISGHPFLTRRGLYELARRGLSLEEFAAVADREDGPFGDHLRRILIMLAKDPELLQAMRGVLRGEPCPTAESFYRLRSAGVIGGSSAYDIEPRCELYISYLRRHLQ